MKNVKIEFKPNPKLKERSDLFLDDKLLGDIGTNLEPVIKGCFDIYQKMFDYVEKNYGKEELEKNYTPEELSNLVKKDYEKAVNIILYQVGKKAFLGFKGILAETAPVAKLKGATGILKDVKLYLSMLGPESAPTTLSDANKENAKMFADNFQIITDVLNETAETVIFLFRGFVVDQCEYAAGVTDAFNMAVGNNTINILNYPPKTHAIRALQGRHTELQEELDKLNNLREQIKVPMYKGRYEALKLLSHFNNSMADSKAHPEAKKIVSNTEEVYVHNDHKNEISAKFVEFLNTYQKTDQSNIAPKKGDPKNRLKDDDKSVAFDNFYNTIDKHLDARIKELEHAIEVNNAALKKVKRNPLRWIQYLLTSDKLTKRIFRKKAAVSATTATEVSSDVQDEIPEANKRSAFSFKSRFLKQGKTAVVDNNSGSKPKMGS